MSHRLGMTSLPSPSAAPATTAETSLVDWLDGHGPVGTHFSGSAAETSSRNARLCRVVAVALREGVSCWTVRMVPEPRQSQWWLPRLFSKLVLRAVYPALDIACRGYGSELQLPNAMEVAVSVPVG